MIAYVIAMAAMRNFDLNGHDINLSIQTAPAVVHIQYPDKELARLKGIEIAEKKWPKSKGWTGHICSAMEKDWVQHRETNTEIIEK